MMRFAGDRLCAPDDLDVVCAGEALWDLASPPGRTFADAASLRFQPGGAAVNVALRLARLGWRAGLAAVVGEDALGEALVARVAARGVSTALVRKAPSRTGLFFMEHAGQGTRGVSYRSAGEEAPDLGAAWRARALLLTGLVPSPEQGARFGAAAAEGRRRGALVVVDVNARPRLWQGRGGAPAWVADAGVVKASEEDLAAMGLDERAMRAAMGPEAVLVVTAGPRTARAIGPFGEGRAVPRPAKAKGRAIGAGDAFTAGVLDVLLREGGGDRWEGALRRGHVLARPRVIAGG